jgi:hypothetical protein
MKNINLFKEWLGEAVEAADPATLNWTNPVKAGITKAADRGGNVIEVKSADGRVFAYKIIGYAANKTYAINFNWLKKNPKTGGMIIGRTVQGGVEPYEVALSDLATILPALTSGKSAEHGNWVAGVKFTKI